MNPTAKQNRGNGASRAAHILAFGVLISGMPAQDESQPSAKSADAEKSVPAKKASTSISLAMIKGEKCRVRCFASNLSPVYDGEIAVGTIVQVGEEVGEFRRIILPRGVPGYVSKRFSTAPEDGMLQTTRKLVSFRYRPTPKRRAEEPVERMSKGTTMHFLGEVGDWWKVRFVTQSAYVRIKEIEAIADVTDDVCASHAKFEATHDAEWKNAVTGYEKSLKLLADNDRHTKRLVELRTTFHAEAKKALSDQKLKPILEGVEALIAELPKKAPLLATAKFLESAIQRQQVFADADRLINAVEPPPPEPKIKLTKGAEDELSKTLHTIGWLSYRPSAPGPSAYRLEKGGRVISYVYCSSLRYDLSLFDGIEIGVRGVRKRDAAVPYLDVHRIEVIGTGK